MNDENVAIFVDYCRELNGTFVVSGLHYKNDEDENPEDMDFHGEYTDIVSAIAFAEETAKSYLPIDSIVLVDGEEYTSWSGND